MTGLTEKRGKETEGQVGRDVGKRISGFSERRRNREVREEGLTNGHKESLRVMAMLGT